MIDGTFAAAGVAIAFVAGIIIGSDLSAANGGNGEQLRRCSDALIDASNVIAAESKNSREAIKLAREAVAEVERLRRVCSEGGGR